MLIMLDQNCHQSLRLRPMFFADAQLKNFILPSGSCIDSSLNGTPDIYFSNLNDYKQRLYFLPSNSLPTLPCVCSRLKLRSRQVWHASWQKALCNITCWCQGRALLGNIYTVWDINWVIDQLLLDTGCTLPRRCVKPAP